MVLRHAMELDVVVQDVEEAAVVAGLAQGEISAMLMPMASREGMVVAASRRGVGGRGERLGKIMV